MFARGKILRQSRVWNLELEPAEAVIPVDTRVPTALYFEINAVDDVEADPIIS